MLSECLKDQSSTAAENSSILIFIRRYPPEGRNHQLCHLVTRSTSLLIPALQPPPWKHEMNRPKMTMQLKRNYYCIFIFVVLCTSSAQYLHSSTIAAVTGGAAMVEHWLRRHVCRHSFHDGDCRNCTRRIFVHLSHSKNIQPRSTKNRRLKPNKLHSSVIRHEAGVR